MDVGGPNFPAVMQPISDRLSAVETAANQLNTQLGSVPQYVSATRLHCADLIANFPAASQYRGMLARVDDLYGAIDGTLVCGTDGTRYFWRPNGFDEFMSGNVAVTTDTVFTALGHPTILLPTGTIGIGVTRKITLDPTNIWPGARKRVNIKGVTSLLGTLQVLNGVSQILNLALNGVYEFGADFSSGTGQWVQI